jgi:choline dehydrogenase
MREGLKWGLRMAQTAVFKNNQIRPVYDKFSCGQFEAFSDDYFECYLKHWSHTVYHPAGTCKMGPKDDAMAVVDAELKLHGIQNLRVIDASIMPAIVGSNTNAPTIMIGEKGADMIIKSWKLEKANHSKKDYKQKTEL